MFRLFNDSIILLLHDSRPLCLWKECSGFSSRWPRWPWSLELTPSRSEKFQIPLSLEVLLFVSRPRRRQSLLGAVTSKRRRLETDPYQVLVLTQHKRSLGNASPYVFGVFCNLQCRPVSFMKGYGSLISTCFLLSVSPSVFVVIPKIGFI